MLIANLLVNHALELNFEVNWLLLEFHQAYFGVFSFNLIDYVSK